MPILLVSEHVLDLCDGSSEDSPTGGLIRLRGPRVHLPQHLEHLGQVVVMGDEVHQLAIEPVHCAHARAAEAYRAGHDGVEDGLHIGGRA